MEREKLHSTPEDFKDIPELIPLTDELLLQLTGQGDTLQELDRLKKEITSPVSKPIDLRSTSEAVIDLTNASDKVSHSRPCPVHDGSKSNQNLRQFSESAIYHNERKEIDNGLQVQPSNNQMQFAQPHRFPMSYTHFQPYHFQNKIKPQTFYNHGWNHNSHHHHQHPRQQHQQHQQKQQQQIHQQQQQHRPQQQHHLQRQNHQQHQLHHEQQHSPIPVSSDSHFGQLNSQNTCHMREVRDQSGRLRYKQILNQHTEEQLRRWEQQIKEMMKVKEAQDAKVNHRMNWKQDLRNEYKLEDKLCHDYSNGCNSEIRQQHRRLMRRKAMEPIQWQSVTEDDSLYIGDNEQIS